MEQEIRFCTAPDGVRLAYAIHGHGPPLVRPSTWLTHLEYDWESPIWRHWLRALGARHTVIRYDERGCGLSDRDVEEISFERWVSDLETVVDTVGLERFPLLGVSGGGPLSIAYAVRHPERVSALVLYGTHMRGRAMRGDPEQQAQADAFAALVRAGWGSSEAAFRRPFTTLFCPDATSEQMEWFDELQRRTAEPEVALRIRLGRDRVDVTELAPRVRAPTLVMHARDDAMVPFAEGRRLAAAIPGAQLVPLEGRNHILLADEPAWPAFLGAVHRFLGTKPPAAEIADLSARELEVLELVAAGMSNEEIAERLVLSVRTVERHLSNVYVKLRISGKAARAAAAARFSQQA